VNKGKEKHNSREDHGNARSESGRKEEPQAGDPAEAGSGQASGEVSEKNAAPAAASAVDKVAEQAAAIAGLQDQLLRLRADFDNFRKRTLREKTDLYDSATSDLMLDLLPVLDHLQLGIQAAHAHKAIQEGLRLIFDQLMGVLSKFGLVPFDVERQPFDPARSEAISQMASDQVPEGVVLAQTRRGYMLRDKLLRPAQVVVSSGPAADKQPK
jgi:molecular chaperone GrpE